MPGMPNPFCIGSDTWPGISKLNEESGEIVQVIGKMMANGGAAEHWDGTNLHVRLLEEMADVQAAIDFVLTHNFSNTGSLAEFHERTERKRALFEKWHEEQQALWEPYSMHPEQACPASDDGQHLLGNRPKVDPLGVGPCALCGVHGARIPRG